MVDQSGERLSVSMFRGVSELSLDSKGRITVPTRHREPLITSSSDETEKNSSTGTCIVTIDTEENCHLIYPLAQWEKIETQIEALPSFNKQARKVQRLLLGHATEVNIDSHGRMLIPPPLREFAHLDKQCVLIGQGKKFELWSKADWDQQRDTWLKEGTEEGDDVPPSLLSISL